MDKNDADRAMLTGKVKGTLLAMQDAGDITVSLPLFSAWSQKDIFKISVQGNPTAVRHTFETDLYGHANAPLSDKSIVPSGDQTET